MDTTHEGIYRKKELIGKGTFGKIFKAQRTGTGDVVALKEIDTSKCHRKDKEHVQSEVELLQTCRHKNLVQFIESFSNDKLICIVMELCNGGNLREYIQSNNGLSEEECICVLQQICDGLKYLHEKNIAHRDVKTTNILLQKHNDELLIKIGDFGLARIMDMIGPATNLTTCVGSPYFMSPEMIQGKAYNISTDIWSLGCCAYEMATTDVPYVAKEMDGLKERIQTDQVDVSKIPYCQEMQTLIMKMMDKESAKRPRVQDILTFLHQHTHTKKSSEGKLRRKTDKFASTWSPGVKFQHCTHGDTPTYRRLDDSSGYDSCVEKKDRGEIVHVPVRMTEDDKENLAKAEQLQKDILRKIGDTGVLEKISAAVERTKHMDTYSLFMVEMEKILGDRIFAKCKCDLGALWTYRTELLKKNFRLAWS